MGAPILAQEAASSKTGESAETNYRTELEKETFLLINQYRKDNKLTSFVWSGDIAKVARAHSKDMATGDVDFGHDGFGKRVKELKVVMVGLNGAGENVLKTDDPDQVAQSAVRIWLNSPHHLENIRGDFNYSGIGVWRDDQGMVYFTQIFVKIEPETAEAQAAPAPALATPFTFLADPKTR